MEFKDEMRTIIIPSVERMIEKERVHLATLQAIKARIINMSFLRRLFIMVLQAIKLMNSSPIQQTV
jgi:hypothetical protein